MSTADVLVELSKWLQRSAARVHRAQRNMREAGPGFPSSSQGSGSGGGGSGTGTSIVERIVVDQQRSIDEDDAIADAARLDQLTAQLRDPLREVFDICNRWGFTTAGEFDVRERRNPTSGEQDESTKKWCVNHLRVQVCEPVYSGELCRWCYDFKQAEAWLPDEGLLDMRSSGRKITRAMIDARKPKPKKEKTVRVVGARNPGERRKIMDQKAAERRQRLVEAARQSPSNLTGSTRSDVRADTVIGNVREVAPPEGVERAS